MHREHNIPITIARPFNTFGPRQSTRAVIPTIITQILKNNTIKIGNIQTSRDFLYVKDNVDALVKLLISKNTDGEVINISTQYSVKIIDVINFLQKYLGKKFEITQTFNRFRKSEVFNLVGSNLKIRQLIKWKPMYSGKNGFNKGLIETYNWFDNPENLSYYKNFSKYNI